MWYKSSNSRDKEQDLETNVEYIENSDCEHNMAVTKDEMETML